jgi:hypothetical protein
MTSLSRSQRDHILWLLENNGGKMERAFLRRRIGWRYAILDPILEELEKEGKIKVTLGPKGGMISLRK